MADWGRFAEKLQLAVEVAVKDRFEAGTCGLEVEFNVLDERLAPVGLVGFGPGRRSLADVLVEERIPAWARSRVQREVFHWMVEFATRPYYDVRGPAFEAAVLEGVLTDVLFELGLSAGHRLLALHGNIPHRTVVDRDSIPAGWSLAKRRYLARCVELFGSRLATAGIHSNHSLPEPLLAWDFIHLPRGRREGRGVADFRNDAMIRAARLLRPFCPLFIAVSASTPLAAATSGGRSEIVLTANDSNRLLTFPNPPELDVPGLYASYPDYLRLSTDLVRRGVRFGANNWTPVRARSDVDPINLIVRTTSEQLAELYRRGIYASDEHPDLAVAEQALVIENLCALVDLPMTRVEVRTDEGGGSLELAVARTVLKQLLVLRIYADPAYGAGFRYDAADIGRARRNEEAAARRGLDAVVEHPWSGEVVPMREWLAAVLEDLRELAAALGWEEALEPVRAMAEGAANPAQRLRLWLEQRMRASRRTLLGDPVVAPGLVLEWIAGERERVARETAAVVEARHELGEEAGKLGELTVPFEAWTRENAALPVRAAAPAPADVTAVADGEVASVVRLAVELIRIPSVTNCADERLGEVERCARFLAGTLQEAGLEVRLWETGRYPALVAGFPGALLAPVVLSGHFDVVRPEPNDSQFEPHVEGDYLWGRGSADMKTVVATNVEWMLRRRRAGPPWPPVSMMLVGNEENGEREPFGTPHLLRDLAAERGWRPELMLVGERTGEGGDERLGEVCVANRGVVRVRFVAHGERTHTGFAGRPVDLVGRLVAVRAELEERLGGLLTLEAPDGWRSTATFPFLNVGEVGVYNISAGTGNLGLEVRPIPADDAERLVAALGEIAGRHGVELVAEVVEGGVACPPDNPLLALLLTAVERVGGCPPGVGRKLAGTSARFAPGGNAVVWGQSGIGPHSRSERHFIPSIRPYLEVLDAFAASLPPGPPAVGRRS